MSDYVLPEVVMEVLKWLPVKSLLRFRCVCRDWCSLISSPNFISEHLTRASSSPTTHTLVRRYSKLHSKEIYTVYNNDKFTGESTRINFPGKSKFYSRVVGYCNGILCLSDDLFGYKETIILWNPSIRRVINVPAPSVINTRCGLYMFALGFGYDSVSDDYKIVRVAYLVDGGYKFPPKVEVFSVSLGKWRLVKCNITSCITERLWSQAVRDSVVHWVGYGVSREGKGRSLIVSFNMSTEIFGELSLPESLINFPFMNMFVVMLRGLVSVLYYQKMIGCCSCAVWVMKDYGNVGSWVNQYNVNVEQEFILVSLRDNRTLLAKRNGELVSYNYENETTTRTGICGTALSFFVDKYVESLFLMGKGREVRARDREPDYEDEDELVEMEEEEQLLFAMMNIYLSNAKVLFIFLMLFFCSMVVGMLGNNGLIVATRELVSFNYKNGTTTTSGICCTMLSFFADRYVECLVLVGKGREVWGRDQEPDYENEDKLVEKEEDQQLAIALRNICRNVIKITMN